MAEFIYNEIQQIPAGSSALLNDAIPCNRGYVLHRPGSGILTFKGAVNNPCARFARYKIAYGCNIAVPTAVAPGEIQVAIAIGGEVLSSSIAAATPTVADAYWNVSGFAIIDVPVGCCYTVAIENATVSEDPATTPAIPINMRNLNVEVTRLA